LRARVERGDQFRVGDVVGLGYPAVSSIVIYVLAAIAAVVGFVVTFRGYSF
jgi:hypothetical protein